MSIEFSQIEMALKKRMGEIMEKIEEEVHMHGHVMYCHVMLML